MIHSFLLIGQSNMAGRGFLEEAKTIDNTRIKTLRNGYWEEMFRPINPDRSFAGVNLAESFAESYAKRYNTDVGLICCANGGTSLDEWEPGGVLFDQAVFQAKLAQRSSVIAGILWHQGEADCGEGLYNTYEERFLLFEKALREELSLFDVPLLVGGLGDFLKDCPLSEALKNYTRINLVLQRVAEKHDMMGFVSAEGLAANPDNLHFNAAALYEFGLRYFKEFEKFPKAERIIDTMGCSEDAQRTIMAQF